MRCTRWPGTVSLGTCRLMISKSSSIESIRRHIRESEQYTTVRGRYLLGSLVPSGPISVVIAKMIKAVDDGFSYDGIGSVPDPVPPVTPPVLGWKVLFTARAWIPLRRLVKRRETVTLRYDRSWGARPDEFGPRNHPRPPEDTVRPSQPPGSFTSMPNPTPAVPTPKQSLMVHAPAINALAPTVRRQKPAAPVRAFDLS